MKALGLALPRGERESDHFNGLKKGLGENTVIARQGVSKTPPKPREFTKPPPSWSSSDHGPALPSTIAVGGQPGGLRPRAIRAARDDSVAAPADNSDERRKGATGTAVQPIWNFACNRGTADRHGVPSFVPKWRASSPRGFELCVGMPVLNDGRASLGATPYLSSIVHCRRAAQFRVFDLSIAFGSQFVECLTTADLPTYWEIPRMGKCARWSASGRFFFAKLA